MLGDTNTHNMKCEFLLALPPPPPIPCPVYYKQTASCKQVYMKPSLLGGRGNEPEALVTFRKNNLVTELATLSLILVSTPGTANSNSSGRKNNHNIHIAVNIKSDNGGQGADM